MIYRKSVSNTFEIKPQRLIFANVLSKLVNLFLMVFREEVKEVDIKHVNKVVMKDAVPVRAAVVNTVTLETAVVKEVLEDLKVVVAVVVTKEGDFSKQI